MCDSGRQEKTGKNPYSCNYKKQNKRSFPVMKIVTQKARFRQALLTGALKHGAGKAARKYEVSRQYTCRWRKRWDGTEASLMDRSRRPHSHKRQHTEEEAALIAKMREENKNDGLVVFWVKLRLKGYTRSISGLYRFMKGRGLKGEKPANPKYVPKPYEKMSYPGERIQIDVKYVPKSCLSGCENADMGYFQYTAIDEYSRYRYVEGFNEHNTSASTRFLEHLIRVFPCKIECVQTDNGLVRQRRTESLPTALLRTRAR
jgi:hypothetical protein